MCRRGPAAPPLRLDRQLGTAVRGDPDVAVALVSSVAAAEARAVVRDVRGSALSRTGSSVGRDARRPSKGCAGRGSTAASQSVGSNPFVAVRSVPRKGPRWGR
jgi:hypothetical protein